MHVMCIDHSLPICPFVFLSLLLFTFLFSNSPTFSLYSVRILVIVYRSVGNLPPVSIPLKKLSPSNSSCQSSERIVWAL